MALTLELKDLSSRLIRKASAGNDGIRRIALHATTSTHGEDDVLKNIYDGLLKFGAGLLRGTIAACGLIINFSWTAVWQACTQAYFFLFNFNWNVSDADLDAQVKTAETALAAAKGRLAGQSLGYAVCGLIPTATIAVFNEPMAMYIMAELGEEAAEELSSSLASLLKLQFQQQARGAFISFFKNYRTLLRDCVGAIAQTLVDVGVITEDSMAKLYTNRNKPWSFAGALQESIDSLNDPAKQAYAEEFYDELQDACLDAGFIVTSGIDSYMATQKISNESFFGKEKIIEITPNRALDPDEEEHTP